MKLNPRSTCWETSLSDNYKTNYSNFHGHPKKSTTWNIESHNKSIAATKIHRNPGLHLLLIHDVSYPHGPLPTAITRDRPGILKASSSHRLCSASCCWSLEKSISWKKWWFPDLGENYLTTNRLRSCELRLLKIIHDSDIGLEVCSPSSSETWWLLVGRGAKLISMLPNLHAVRQSQTPCVKPNGFWLETKNYTFQSLECLFPHFIDVTPRCKCVVLTIQKARWPPAVSGPSRAQR